MPKFFAKTRAVEQHPRHLISGHTREMTELQIDVAIRTPDDIDQIISQAPRTVLEKTERFLRTLAKMCGDHAKISRLNPENDYPLVYGKAGPELKFVIDYLKSQGLVTLGNPDSNDWICGLTLPGWVQYESRERTGVDSVKAFVAMAFNEDMLPSYNNGIKPAIEKCGFRPIRIDKEQFLGRIVDEILGHIRESRFVVADMTFGKGGMYFEGGFAMGLGKPVIWSCRDDEVEKVHFDTRHYNHLTWKSPEDLKEKLELRIRATIGLAAGVVAQETKSPLPE